MELDTINEIRRLRDSIREKIKGLDKSNYSSSTYGEENEYNFKGVISDLDSMLTDISCLTKGSEKFVKISTYDERKTIVDNLTSIDAFFDDPADYIEQFNALKILLRNYNVRDFSERQLEFVGEIELVLKLKLQVQEELAEVKQIKEEITKNQTAIEESFKSSTGNLEKIGNELTRIIKRKGELITHSYSLEETSQEIVKIKEVAEGNLVTINESMSESKSNEKLITSFALKVQEREKRLGELEQNTEENNSKLKEYEQERITILDNANALITSAKEALNYKTAEGISASFQEHYESSKNLWIISGWIIGAVICLGGTIGLGIWILQNSTTSIGLIIGRVSMLPLPIIGAIFCANQYTKQKNIIEDYAYKMVLSKAIVGFSEQLKKNGSGENVEYVHYIKTALEEIHKDPLRKRDKAKEEKPVIPGLKDLVEVAERIVKMSKLE